MKKFLVSFTALLFSFNVSVFGGNFGYSNLENLENSIEEILASHLGIQIFNAEGELVSNEIYIAIFPVTVFDAEGNEVQFMAFSHSSETWNPRNPNAILQFSGSFHRETIQMVGNVNPAGMTRPFNGVINGVRHTGTLTATSWVFNRQLGAMGITTVVFFLVRFSQQVKVSV